MLAKDLQEAVGDTLVRLNRKAETTLILTVEYRLKFGHCRNTVLDVDARSFYSARSVFYAQIGTRPSTRSSTSLAIFSGAENVPQCSNMLESE